MPLIIILQKAIGNAGFSKSGVKDALEGAQVFKRGGACNSSKEETQIEALSRRGMGIIHPAYLKAPLCLTVQQRVSLCQTILLGKF